MHDHFVVPGDDTGIIHIIGGVEIDGGVVMDVLIKQLAPHGAAGDQLPVIKPFLAVCDHTTSHQVHDVVRNILAVDAQILLMGKCQQGGLAGHTRPDLQG